MFSTNAFFWKDAPLHEREGQKIRYQCTLPRVINDLELLVDNFSIIGEYE